MKPSRAGRLSKKRRLRYALRTMMYDYTCKACNNTFEIQATMEETARGLSPACPACGSEETSRLFSPLGVITGGATRREFEPCSPSCACASQMQDA